MFAPPTLVATAPPVDHAAANITVVVLLPLVPDTNATLRSAASRANASESAASAMRPPMMPPRRPQRRTSWLAAIPSRSPHLSGRRGEATLLTPRIIPSVLSDLDGGTDTLWVRARPATRRGTCWLGPRPRLRLHRWSRVVPRHTIQAT